MSSEFGPVANPGSIWLGCMIVVKVEELPMTEPGVTLVIWLEGPQVVGLSLVASLLFICLSLLLF